MNATETHRDLAAILADLDTSATASLSTYRELASTVRAALTPLPAGEADRMAAEADLAARTMAPPMPGVTRHNDYIVRAVIYRNPKVPGLLEAWWVAGEDTVTGHWVTWNAYAGDPAGSQAGRLSYDAGNYFEGTDAAGNKHRAIGDLAVRAGTMPEVARRIADEIAKYTYAEPEDKRMASRLRRYFTR